MFEDTIYNYRKELQALGYCKITVANYPRAAQLFLLHTDKIPQEITQEDIKNYYHYLQQRPNKIRKDDALSLPKGLSKNTVLRELTAVKSYFNYLQRTNQIKSNPFVLQIKSPLCQERTVLTPQEIEELYKQCKTKEEKVVLHLCYGCGLRKSEAQNLNVGDVHFEKKLLYVRKGKGKKRRVIPLTGRIAKDLKLFIEKKSKDQQAKEVAFLTNSKGGRMQGNTIYILFKNLLKRTGNHTDISLHNLRHSIATHLLENNMSIEMVRDFLGHGQLNTTQIYTRVNLFRDERRKT
jgi:integrase/recombinase XerD